jgi:hypothetical protein
MKCNQREVFMKIDVAFVLLICVLASFVAGLYAIWSGGNFADGDIETLSLEVYKKGVKEKLRKSLLAKRAALSPAAQVLSREEFCAMIKEGVEAGMAEELSESECERIRGDVELQQTISDITDSVYDELFQDKN